MPSKQPKWCDSGTPGIAIGRKTSPKRPKRQTAKPPRRTAPLSAHDISPSRKENGANFRSLFHHHGSHPQRRDRVGSAGAVTLSPLLARVAAQQQLPTTAAAAATTAGTFAIGRAGNVAATGERPVMHAAITLNAKGLVIADILDHRARVAANSQRVIGTETMVIVQVKELIHVC